MTDHHEPHGLELVATDHPMTTAEKFAALRVALLSTDPEEMPPEVRQFVSGIQIANGLGYDILAGLVPDDPNDAALMVDRAIVMLMALRGDDLPPLSESLFGELQGADVEHDTSSPWPRQPDGDRPATPYSEVMKTDHPFLEPKDGEL